MSEQLQVWVGQDECTGCSLCPETAEKVFHMGDDGLAYTNQEPDETGVELLGLFTVDPADHMAVIEAAEDCPGLCIYVEYIPQAR